MGNVKRFRSSSYEGLYHYSRGGTCNNEIENFKNLEKETVWQSPFFWRQMLAREFKFHLWTSRIFVGQELISPVTRFHVLYCWFFIILINRWKICQVLTYCHQLVRKITWTSRWELSKEGSFGKSYIHVYWRVQYVGGPG